MRRRLGPTRSLLAVARRQPFVLDSTDPNMLKSESAARNAGSTGQQARESDRQRGAPIQGKIGKRLADDRCEFEPVAAEAAGDHLPFAVGIAVDDEMLIEAFRQGVVGFDRLRLSAGLAACFLDCASMPHSLWP